MDILDTLGIFSFLAMGLAFLLGILFAVYYVIFFLITAVVLVSLLKLFQKAGVAGWKALIPIYNIYNISEIAFGGTKKWLSYVSVGLPVLMNIMNPNINTVLGTIGMGILNTPMGAVGVIPAQMRILQLAIMLLSIILYVFFFLRYSPSLGVWFGLMFFPFIFIPIVAFSKKYQFSPYGTKIECKEKINPWD